MPPIENNDSLETLKTLASENLGGPSDFESIPGGGSERDYYRFSFEQKSIIGATGKNPTENAAFLGFTAHFSAQGIPVPEILGASEDQSCYLMQDLGEETLAQALKKMRKNKKSDSAINAVREVISWLPRIQVRGGDGLDYSLCSEGQELNGKQFAKDVGRFLDHFLPVHAPEQIPSPMVMWDFNAFLGQLEEIERTHFCYRDFQARNIMWPSSPDLPSPPVFLDYQSGRKGALQYDLASFLFSPDTGLNAKERGEMIELYLENLAGCGVKPEPEVFEKDLYKMVFIRRIQALGAYGELGGKPGGEAYLEKIPAALSTLRELAQQKRFSFGLPALEDWLKRWLR